MRRVANMSAGWYKKSGAFFLLSVNWQRRDGALGFMTRSWHAVLVEYVPVRTCALVAADASRKDRSIGKLGKLPLKNNLFPFPVIAEIQEGAFCKRQSRQLRQYFFRKFILQRFENSRWSEHLQPTNICRSVILGQAGVSISKAESAIPGHIGNMPFIEKTNQQTILDSKKPSGHSSDQSGTILVL